MAEESWNLEQEKAYILSFLFFCFSMRVKVKAFLIKALRLGILFLL